MAVRTWTGAVSNLWNVAGNWDTLPSAGDDLVFPSSASNKSNSNDFTADTFFNSITIQGNGYTLAGNRITLGAGGITQTTGTNTVSLAIVLGAAVTVSVEGTVLALSGIISDGAGSSVAKAGTSLLSLRGTNTFTGGLTIKAGTCELSTSTSAGGGSGTGVINIGDTSGSADAQLLPAVAFANPITAVAGSSGKAIINSSANRTSSGAITLAKDLYLNPTASGTLTVTGGITGTGNLITQCDSTGGVTISTTTLNHTGTITNSGSGTGTTTISAVIGTNVTGVTQASATSPLVLSGTGTYANCSDKFSITSGTIRLASNNTVGNLFIDATGCTDKTASLELIMTDLIVTGEFKPRGSVTNRLLVASNILGTARTLTITGATISNSQAVDFRDITFANGGANVDLSAITGGSGDCGGNTISGGGVLSFTTADDWYWYSASGGTYNLSDRTYWFTATNGGGTQMGADRGPLPQDMLYVDGSSINGTTTIDQDMPRMPGIDFTGTDAVAFHVNNVQQICYGSFIGAANVTYTGSNSYTLTMGTRGSVTLSPVSTFQDNVTIAAVGGSVTLGSNMSGSTSLVLTLQNGAFDADTYNLNGTTFTGSGSNARALLMGSGTWMFLYWNFATTTNLTSTSVGESSAIVFGSAVSGISRTFAGGGLTYNNLSIVANTTGINQVTVSGNNTFNTLTINGPKTINFTAGSVQTVSAFATTGTGIVLKSTSAGSPWYLVDASATNQVSNCTISDSYPRGSDAGGGALWKSPTGANNVDGGGNVAHDPATKRGWNFVSFLSAWYVQRRRQRA